MERVPELAAEIERVIEEKGAYTVAVAGSPGTGKSKAARFIREHGFFTIPPEKVFVIDDLRGPEGERYRRQELAGMEERAVGKVLFLFDFRAARYLKRADLGILLQPGEKERIENLKKRSPRSYRRYGKRFYRFPPVPRRFKQGSLYICRENFHDMLGAVHEGLH